jgi:hypothetical protein
MSKPVYIAQENGDLKHRLSGKVIGVESFTIGKGRRGETIEVSKRGGGTKNILRFQVDETAFSFGPAGEAAPAKEKTTAVTKRPAAAAHVHAAPPPTVDGRIVSLSRDEALELLKATRAASDLLFTKLLDETLSR